MDIYLSMSSLCVGTLTYVVNLNLSLDLTDYEMIFKRSVFSYKLSSVVLVVKSLGKNKVLEKNKFNSWCHLPRIFHIIRISLNQM